MPFYEIVYEDGSHSVAEYNDDADALRATQAHHLRAMEGGPANSTVSRGDAAYAVKAVRIVKVLKYNQHPDNYNPTQLVEVKDAQETIKAAGNEKGHGGLVSVHDLGNAVRDMSNPVVTDAGAHDSMYKMDEEKDIWTEPEGDS